MRGWTRQDFSSKRLDKSGLLLLEAGQGRTSTKRKSGQGWTCDNFTCDKAGLVITSLVITSFTLENLNNDKALSFSHYTQ